MLVNLTDVLTTEGKAEEKQVALETDVFRYQGQEYEILEKHPFSLKLTNLENGKAEIKGQTSLTMKFFCDRCLEEVPYTFELAFTLEASEEEGYELDVENLLNNEIMLNWPMKILCREDCKGICSVCGKNLNTGACGCDTFVPDPRMAKIQEIFNRDKEV
ncbi:MAG: DUF177 domain-containing protein [Clostridiales bacterium]|nr:DUF177 domain-containing protein [Clostridiales bacterium]